MDISIKLRLLEKYNFSLTEIQCLDRMNLSDEVIDVIMSEESSDVTDKCLLIKNDASQSDDSRLLAARLTRKSSSIEDDDDWDEDGDEFDNYFNAPPEHLDEDEKATWIQTRAENEARWREEEKLFYKNLPIVKKWTQEEFNEKMFAYMWENYPELHYGYDRSVFVKARDGFPKHTGLYYRRCNVPEEVWKKLDNATEYCKEEINRRFAELEISNVEQWKNEYVEWMQQEGVTKINKTYIRAFFKARNIKASAITVDRIKELLD